MAQKFKAQTFTGERARFASANDEYESCTFADGESPLKHSRGARLFGCVFDWKYPLWYSEDAVVDGCEWRETGRSGVWYTKNIHISNSTIAAPKQFRRSSGVRICACSLPRAEETLWSCSDVQISDSTVVGDYFGMNCNGVTLKNVRIDGNYCFDDASDIVAEDCVFNSKDAFWNCKNVVIKNSVIIGEYLAWNSQNITFINCTIESHQGLCYIEGLRLEGCALTADLAFEYCSDIRADLTTCVESIKNPYSGYIRCKGVGELIADPQFVDPNKTLIEVCGDE